MNPGREEIKAGVAFVGDSGKLLDSYLKSAMIPDNGYWLTNAVCFRTNHRKGESKKSKEPTLAEMKNCRTAHLIHELQERTWRENKGHLPGKEPIPSVIVTLGSFATRALTGGTTHKATAKPLPEFWIT